MAESIAVSKVEPTYLSQGVSYLGFLAQQLGDLRGKTTLAHELIQNADDAKDDNGNLAATKITFDVTDEALLVHNDAVFRDSDFKRMQMVASGSKRNEDGARTTGAFGIGFISVYQVTDRPEIHSAGRRWILRPDEPEERRIEEWSEPSMTPNKGTLFKLPWAFKESSVREGLKSSLVDAGYIESFVLELKESLPKAILFLKSLECIELRHNSKIISRIEKTSEGNLVVVADQVNDTCTWMVLNTDFSAETQSLFSRFPGLINGNLSSHVRVAIPDSPSSKGLLYATLPTEELTHLPFHIDADFYPTSDRKSIAFEDSSDYRSEWNRAALNAAASAIKSNLLLLRNALGDDASEFWRFLGQIQNAHQEHQGNHRKPLGVFWDTLLPALAKCPVAFTESGKWLVPSRVRISTRQEQVDALSVYETLGFEIVHRDLSSYRNILIRNDVGVRTLTLSEICDALKRKGLYGKPCHVPEDFQTRESLSLFWKGIFAVAGREKEALREYALAPGLDGRLYPCRSAFRSDECTRELFASILPDDCSFLQEEDVIQDLIDLCSRFTAERAVEFLERRTDKDSLLASRSGEEYGPVGLLRWFDDNKSSLTRETRRRLARLPMFPSATGLHPLDGLWMQGGFPDPLGNADLLDMNRLDGLSDFLRALGARELSFRDYAERYIPDAFSDNSAVSLKSKRALLDILEKHIGELKAIPGMRGRLANSRVIECSDGAFRLPGDVYFPAEGTTDVLGEYANYVKSAHLSEVRRDFYEWLGVADSPRIKDMLNIISDQAGEPPKTKSKALITKMLEALGSAWDDYSDSEKAQCAYLKNIPWLPSEDDAQRWYTPRQLYAAYFKYLFASQGKFIDISVAIQQRYSTFLSDIGVKSRPEAYQVVRHLKRCVERNIKPPNGIYRWLNDNASHRDLQELKEAKCLWVKDKYYSPAQVYWGSHLFGRFRVQLGQDIRGFQKLLDALGVRDAPDYHDALNVLKEVSDETGNGYLQPEDEKVVLSCWEMLSDALNKDHVTSESLEAFLKEVPCVPNKQKRLYKPSWMFFNDKPDVALKFHDIIKGNTIDRLDRVWPAMSAAGVSPVSDAMQEVILEKVNPFVDETFRARILERRTLIKSICENAKNELWPNPGDSVDDFFGSVQFVRVDGLTVVWRLHAFGRVWPPTPPEEAYTHLDTEARVIYFVQQANGNPQWDIMAREIAHAIAPSERAPLMAPGILFALEAETHQESEQRLRGLGILLIQDIERGQAEGTVAHSLDGDTESSQQPDSWPPKTHGEFNGIDHTVRIPDRMTEPEIPFAERLHREQTITPSPAGQRPVSLPSGGPLTDESARIHTTQSGLVGRSGTRVSNTGTRWQPTEAAENLSSEFRDMVHGDYGKRCQICSRSFAIRDNRLQVYVVHIVPPSKDSRTNNFGDLLGLCGWHYALLQYGDWAFLHAETKQEFEMWEQMRDFISGMSPDIDEMGNEYVGIPIRFHNVYDGWDAEPRTIDEEVRYSNPHWKYLCELIKE